ncbi:DUF3169 family protein [Pseudoflavonifractor sp. An85]|uniref:DUF3169 family protein n=1 Tax=Pseudoflavonifractor sp. An85 TaxID=1965661 RepID=UPI000B38CFEB|nr:DUF3169 family protein [Pseudoflavonifractor sp. An85]OUN25008.1 hypothetical protein B5G37_04940 [Pseudoflavonifractor sp. An85]
MKEAKKKSPARIYLTFAAVLILCALAGGIFGYTTASNELSIHNLSQRINQLLASLGPWWFAPSFLLLAAATWCYLRGRRLLPQAMEDDDIFPQANLTLGWAVFLSNLAMVFTLIAMALSYTSSWGIGCSIVLLVIQLVWIKAIQARTISATKQLLPEKRGNIFDFKFQHDWYQSCDEAERQQIGQCSYQTFKVMTLIFPIVMAVLAVLSTIDLIAPTYSLLVGGLWLVQQFVYNYTSLQMDKARK